MRPLSALILLTTVAAAMAAPRPIDSVDTGAIIRGPVAGDDWGRPLSAGDFDGDGFDDLVVSASESYGSSTSRVFVLRGAPGFHGQGLLDLMATTPDVVITAAQLDDNLGGAVAAGDINGDTIDDLLIVASLADFGGLSDRGIAYVIYGGASFFATPARDLATAGHWDLRLLGPVAAGDMGGASSFGGGDGEGAAIGNLNGDIYGDIVLGVHLADGNRTDCGRVYVKFGSSFASGTTLDMSTSAGYDVQIRGDFEYDELGLVCKTGDITGDGLDEVIAATRWGSQGLFTSEGVAYIFRGRAVWPAFFNMYTGVADIEIRGGRDDDNLGESLAVGDFNGDGVCDLASGAPGADAGAYNDQRGDGIVYGLLGNAQYQTGTHFIDYGITPADFTLVGDFEENLGTLVTSADYNGDGYDDIAAAERFAGPNINGVVEVLFGRSFLPGQSFKAAVDTDVRITGAASDRIGFSLTSANTNGDALAEVVFGTPFNNGNAGTVYVHTHVSGDADQNQRVDMMDLAILQPCIGTVFSAPATLPCVLLDYSLDEQVDGADLPGLAAWMTGP